MARLRAPAGGCPWDRVQTFETLKPYLIEEAYELLEAVERGEPRAHCEELGDVLLQIVFHAQIASELGQFDIDQVVDGIARKLLRRHPHVFGEDQASSPGEVTVHWERIKAEEQAAKGEQGRGLLDGVPRSLPALLQAQRLSERAGRVGFDWHDAAQVMEKVREEMAEFEAAFARIDPEARQAELAWELGDLLFALANLGRHLSFQSEDLLRAACQRFRDRFQHMEQLAGQRGLDMKTMGLDQLEALWQEAKRALAAR
jgi:MazG family protein